MEKIIEQLTQNTNFYINLLIEHLTISGISIIISIILGLLIGIIISQYDKSSKTILSIINFIYTIPSISMLGFLIPLSGIGNTTAIIALSIYALLPMVRSTYTGIKNIDEKLIEASKGMGSTEFQTLTKIKLPLAFPVIMSAIKNMATMTIALTGIASFIGAGGLGVAIYRGITTNNTAMTITGSLIIAMLALLIDFILERIEKFILKRKKLKNKKPIIIIVLLAIIVLIFSLFNAKDTKVKIATKPMTEQYIMGEMLKILVENKTDLNVELTQGVGGGTSNIQPAMESGEFDLYPEYTATGWNQVLKKDGFFDNSMLKELKDEYKEKYDFDWIGEYGFNNTYSLAIRNDLAKKYDINTFSDLAKISNKLTFAAEYDFFEREDGYEKLKKAYDFNFKKTVDLDIGLKYDAINSKKVDCMVIFTTDGQLEESDVKVLKDDKNFYPSYKCINVVRNDIIKKHPELKEILLSLNNKIDDEMMAKMNYKVETQKKSPEAVAREFLEENKLLKE